MDFERKKVFQLIHKKTGSSLITENEKVAKYFQKYSSLGYKHNGIFYVEKFTKKSNSSLWGYQNDKKTHYLYKDSKRELNGENGEEMKVISFLGYLPQNLYSRISENEISDEKDFFVFLQKDKTFEQKILKREDYKKEFKEENKEWSIIGYLWKTVGKLVDTDKIIAENNKPETEEKEDKKEDKEDKEEKKELDDVDSFLQNFLRTENEENLKKEKDNKENMQKNLSKLCQLSKFDSTIDFVIKINGFQKLLELFSSYIEDYSKTKRNAESINFIISLISIFNNFSFSKKSLNHLSNKKTFFGKKYQECLLKLINFSLEKKDKRIIKSLLILFQTSTRMESFNKEFISTNKDLLLYFTKIIEIFPNDYRINNLGLSCINNLSKDPKITNFLVVQKKLFYKKMQVFERVVIHKNIVSILFNLSRYHNELVENEEEIEAIVKSLNDFYDYHKDLVRSSLKLLGKVSLWNLKFLKSINFKKIKTEYGDQKDILQMIDELNELLNK